MRLSGISLQYCGVRCVVLCVWHSSSLLRGGVHSVHVAVAFVRRERGGASVCLSRGVVGSSFALRPRSRRFRIRSFWTASVEPADTHPTVFLTPEPSTAVFWVCCGTVILRSSRGSRLSVCLLFSRLPSTETPRLCISGPFRGCPKP